jgi:hypothetical protein
MEDRLLKLKHDQSPTSLSMLKTLLKTIFYLRSNCVILIFRLNYIFLKVEITSVDPLAYNTEIVSSYACNEPETYCFQSNWILSTVQHWLLVGT